MHERIIFSIVICLCHIIFLEAIIQVTSTVSTITVLLNDFATMNVQFSQIPDSVNWVHQNLNGSQTTITMDGNHYYESPFTELLIFSVGRYDFGFYDCFASDGVDNYHLAIPIKLFETGTPSVISSMTSLDIDPIGQSIELDCTYSDSHVPSDPSIGHDVRWLHCDTSDICSRIDKGNTLKYSGSNVTHPSLTILNYAEDDFGTYWCQVGNEVGTTSSHQIKLLGTVHTLVEITTTTVPGSTTTTTTTPDSTTTTTISDSTTTTKIPGPTTTASIPDPITTPTTIIPDPTTTIVDPTTKTTTIIPDSTTKTTTIPDSTLTSIFMTSENETTGQCGGYNRDEKATFIQYAGAKGSTGHIEDRIDILSSIRCALYCLQCDNCNGYNYQKATRTCQLLQSSLSNYIISSSWDFNFQRD